MENKGLLVAGLLGAVLSIILFLSIIPVLNYQVDNITEKPLIYNMEFTSSTEGDLDTVDLLEWLCYHMENDFSNVDVYVGVSGVIAYEFIGYDGVKYVIAQDNTYANEILRFKLDGTFTVDTGDVYEITYPITISFVAYYG